MIGANESKKGKFVYELPQNVVEIREVFLDSLAGTEIRKSSAEDLTSEEYESLRQLVFCAKPDWSLIFNMLQDGKIQRDSFLASEDFFHMIQELCAERYAMQPMSDVFHTIRSMLFPLLTFFLVNTDCRCYHAISTGYGGILATLASVRTGKPLLLTEHGIYTTGARGRNYSCRWILPSMRKQWIDFFYTLSDAIYSKRTVLLVYSQKPEKLR